MVGVETRGAQEADAHIKRHIAAKPGSPRSHSEWAGDLRRWVTFCVESGIDPMRPGRQGFQDYLVMLRSRDLKDASIRRRLRSVYDFLLYLTHEGVTDETPKVEDLLPPATRAEARDLLSLDEIRRLVSAAKDAPARAGLLLLTVCFLTPGELEQADMNDVTEVEGRPALRIPTRTRWNTVVLPEVVDSAIREAAEGRVRGPLVMNRYGNPNSRANQQRWIDAARARAGIEQAVRPGALNLAARMALMEAGVSFGAVMRGVPPVSDNYLDRQILNARRPISEHPAYRMARLIAGDSRSQLSLLDQAETLAHQDDVDPAAAIALAGAVLERHLRDLAASRGVSVNPKEATIGTYATRLYAGEVILLHHKKRLDVLGHIRNDADHGWFDRVTRAQAFEVIEETRSILGRYRI